VRESERERARERGGKERGERKGEERGKRARKRDRDKKIERKNGLSYNSPLNINIYFQYALIIMIIISILYNSARVFININ